MEKYFQTIKKSPLFCGIGDIRAVLESLGAKIKNYKNGEYIIHYGEKISSLYIVLEGSAIVFRDDFWGNTSIISKSEPSQAFGVSYSLSSPGVSEVDVCAENKTAVMLIDVNKILDSAEYTLVKNLITLLSDRNVYLSGKIEHISQRRLCDKILTYLSDTAKKKRSAKFDIPFSRKQLADYLCADRSALSNELCKLRDEGIIKFNKNHFELLAGENGQ